MGHNASWGAEYQLQKSLYGSDYVVASELSAVRCHQAVVALGGYRERVTHLADLPDAVQRPISSKLPACIEIPVARIASPLISAVVGRSGEV